MLLDLVYRLYERRLEAVVRRGPIPAHVGVLPDGNRRYARRAGLAAIGAGHRRGADKVEELLGWCDELGISVVTLWVLSTDNFDRPPNELAAIFDLIEENVERLATVETKSRHPRRVRAVGRRDLLPASTLAAIERIETATADHIGGELIIGVGYDGRSEITDAVRLLIVDGLRRGESLEGIAGGLNPDEIGRYLYAPDVPDPDLIIRTSGELRLSGFMLWQSAYSEYYFTDVYWPEFRRTDFLRAIRSYGRRQRRRGR
jgi:short-chain Z-isoprenyl diphosphate synthase